MLSAGEWIPHQQNTILFVLVDSSGNEAGGLGVAWTLEISKAGAAFVAGAGSKAEIGSGWYRYTATAEEADTVGPVAVKITHAATVQQNLEYVVGQRTINAVEFTYTVTSSAGGAPIEGVEVAFQADGQTVWVGVTDSFGIARDAAGRLPRLDSGTYDVIAQRAGYTFPVDTEVVDA